LVASVLASCFSGKRTWNVVPFPSHHPGTWRAQAFVAHFGAILFHTLIARDGMLSRTVPWRVRAR